jgi:hypothetical protein
LLRNWHASLRNHVGLLRIHWSLLRNHEPLLQCGANYLKNTCSAWISLPSLKIPNEK